MNEREETKVLAAGLDQTMKAAGEDRGGSRAERATENGGSDGRAHKTPCTGTPG